MKKSINIFVFLFFGLIYSAVCQEKDSIIYWSADQPLNWEDFEGIKIDNAEGATARSHVQIQVLPSLKSNGNNDCLFFATFGRKKSFSISGDVNLLKHEQVHFDIQELFVRKMRKYFERLKQQDPTNTSICTDAFLRYYKELTSYQELYDQETKHSIVKKSQYKWSLKIRKELQSFDNFSAKNLYGNKLISK